MRLDEHALLPKPVRRLASYWRHPAERPTRSPLDKGMRAARKPCVCAGLIDSLDRLADSSKHRTTRGTDYSARPLTGRNPIHACQDLPPAGAARGSGRQPPAYDRLVISLMFKHGRREGGLGMSRASARASASDRRQGWRDRRRERPHVDHCLTPARRSVEQHWVQADSMDSSNTWSDRTTPRPRSVGVHLSACAAPSPAKFGEDCRTRIQPNE